MKATITIQNLKCGGCAATIEKNISKLPYIEGVEIDLETSVVSFNYETEADRNAVETTLERLGYPSVGSQNGMLSKAKSFVSCATGKLSS
ncbi:heavy-metal-associated domain-containing protein [Luteirhabdus pelagi]|uniref:heavy-metal-associated domain-containing protein n=1 Tax=Luteirhabdus pelagi TaxID=2792783 RepID=UPI001939D4CF|nr:heavy metal-associated domain-containing protein [Luteirhabdus pelagi]MCT8340657.1 heavy-metal-associated domain-containing protein [Thermobacterium salinum]